MEDEHSNVHLLSSQFDSAGLHNSDDDALQHDDELDRPLYYVSSNRTSMAKMGDSDEKTMSSMSIEPEMDAERKELVRINTCAIFHKLTPGRGVPHSFIGFVRQWPSLPRVVVRSISPVRLFES